MSNTNRSPPNNNNNNNNNNSRSQLSALAAARAAIAAASNQHHQQQQQQQDLSRTHSNIVSNRSHEASSTSPNAATTTLNRNNNSNSTSHRPISQRTKDGSNSFPLPAYLNFVPGGVEYPPASHYVDDPNHETNTALVHLSKYCNTNANTNDGTKARKKNLSIDTGGNATNSPEAIIHRALRADAALRKYALHYGGQRNGGTEPERMGHRLPSLSVLAEAALVHPLTAVPASAAVLWAEKMILEYMDGRMEDAVHNSPKSEDNHHHDDASSFCTVDTENIPTVQPNDVHLLREATIAAWTVEEATTGRTPTNLSSTTPHNNPNSTKLSDWPTQSAHQLPLPPLSTLLPSLHQLQRGIDPRSSHSRSRIPTGQPCGYVFRRNDIAWNCRTCQTDATCVLCDACFRNSNHEGHEVFFHRTTPGGCCDCGDREAWRVEGCCDLHRPFGGVGMGGGEFCVEIPSEGTTVATNAATSSASSMTVVEGTNDDYEAVRAAKRGRMEHIRHVDGVPPKAVDATRDPARLPPRLAAAMGVVIGSVLKAVQVACRGSAEGADVSQWRLSLADEMCRVWNGVSVDEEYYRRSAVLEKVKEQQQQKNCPLWTVPENVLDASNPNYMMELPKKYNLYLRLHNDDVHTFEEVIRALNHAAPQPNVVPIGGVGSIGKIGGRGLRGAEYGTLSEELLVKSNQKSDVDAVPLAATPSMDNVSMPDATASSAGAEPLGPSQRRPLPANNDATERQQRRYRGDSSPTWTARGFSTHRHPEGDAISALIARNETAQDLTRRVDSDGQVLVREYETLDGVGIGFARLREDAGLHCSVVSTTRIEAEERAKALLEWLTGLVAVHPAVGAMVVQALVDVTDGEDVLCSDGNDGQGGIAKGVAVWSSAKMIPCWSGTHENWWGADGEQVPAWRKRLEVFQPHLESSYLTREEGRELFRQGLMSRWADKFVVETGTNPDFYANIPYSLPDSRLLKSPHALWGTLPITHLVDGKQSFAHPLLRRLANSNDSVMKDTTHNSNRAYLRPTIFVVDTDLRKHEEAEILTTSLYPHKLSGLNLISGTGHVDENGSLGCRYGEPMGVTSEEHAKRLLSCSSFLAPMSPVLLLLLLDPYSPKHVRTSLQRLFLSLLTDARFKSRFAASLGALVYRPTSTLFCAGIGTESDTLLGFTVQLFTTGSLVKALGNLDATRSLLCREDFDNEKEYLCISALPIAYSVVRSIHANILGATREVSNLIVNANEERNGEESVPSSVSAAIALLSYQYGSEHPLNTRLPAAPDDKFIDSRCMKHKRLPHLLRDLEYIFETPGTALKLLTSIRANTTPPMSPDNASDMITPSPSFSSPSSVPNSLSTYSVTNPIDFPSLWARLLRLGQGIDLQKRRISGGHVEYEDERWLGAYGLSLNFSGTGDALSESPFATVSSNNEDLSAPLLSSSVRNVNKEATGNLFAAFFREIKMWLYREGMLETGQNRSSSDIGELEALQRSTLHVSISQLDEASVNQISAATGIAVAQSCDVACESGVKNLPEAKLALLEAALLYERLKLSTIAKEHGSSSHGPLMGDWLKVPNSPLAGDCLSFHLPLHRALARSIRCFCSAIVPSQYREQNLDTWWRLPLLDDDDDFATPDLSPSSDGIILKQDSLSALVKPTHRSSNLRVVWSTGPDCSTQEAQSRRSRARLISTALASTKVVHSLCDHPLRCIAASQQIEHHMWAKNGSSTAGMALNYSSIPLCRSLRDLDLTMVQLSAAGFNIGLGARRVFALLINRFSLDGYLCDPDRRNIFGRMGWVKPPRLQELEHAELLAESFFTTLCVLVSDLPPPPPAAPQDDSALRQSLRRELLHALAVEPKSYSEAMAAALAAISRRDERDGGSVGAGGGASSFRAVFTEVLHSIGQQRSQGTRATGPPTFELKPEGSNEYDPSFYHLRKTDHQHAMDNIARLRKQKLSAISKGSNTDMVLPLVADPPKGHPRFLPSRLMLHVPSMYSAIRRYLMYALFNGSWLPPSEPKPVDIANVDSNEDDDVPLNKLEAAKMDRRTFKRATSEVSNISSVTNAAPGGAAFSTATVAASSKSFLEVLQLLTLQAHTLEECSNLHKELSFLDPEQKSLSASIDVNSYLSHLVYVPNSLVNVWALLCAPDGPLPSEGSGENRGSVLGLCIALFEHRDNDSSNNSGQKSANDDHGGSRALSADGLKWLLRFVGALADGAENVSIARESATSGVPVKSSLCPAKVLSETRDKIRRMLANLPDLWPREEDSATADDISLSAHERNKEARKAAQARVLAKMKKQQASFAASISSQFKDESEKKLMDDDENLCIICRCDDADGDNGPMGYLGHVQRSRVLQLESRALYANAAKSKELNLSNVYRVVGDKGCQLRSTESMDSAPVAFIPQGGIVEVLQSKISPHLNLQSRRVLVKSLVPQNDSGELVQGWASMQSWEGYIILSPLSSLCYSNTRWGPTRPVIRQCGHAAHLRCAEQHCLSLHQRAAGNQPYDGRFSANIEDGEFLCPLCKQLSNIVIPEDICVDVRVPSSFPQAPTSTSEVKEGFEVVKSDISSSAPGDTSRIRTILARKCSLTISEMSSKNIDATHQFGSNLLQAMQLSSDSSNAHWKRQRKSWHPALRRWDFEDDDLDDNILPGTPQIGSCLRLLRQQLISWAAVGHSAAAAEASGRGVQQIVFGEVTFGSVDPWTNFASKNRDSHPMLLELRRTLSASSSLADAVALELGKRLEQDKSEPREEVMAVVGSLICDILEGNHWTLHSSNGVIERQWQIVTPLITSMICHVSKEDTLAARLEARAVAASMWAITGSHIPPQKRQSNRMEVDSSPGVEVDDVGNIASQDTIIASRSNDQSNTGNTQRRVSLPPKPLSIYRTEKSLGVELDPNWGTLNPFDLECRIKDGEAQIPFRPAVASAFLYVPLLAWDLNTFAGGLFSSLLSNFTSDPCVSSTELIQSSQLLLTARLIQVLAVPDGFLCTNRDEDNIDGFDDVDDCWDDAKKKREANAIKNILSLCRKYLPSSTLYHSLDDSSLLQSVGNAILPFGRSLILLLRASTSVIRQRKRRVCIDGLIEETTDDKFAFNLLENPDIMASEDGLKLLECFGAPLPSDIMKASSSQSSWHALVNKWLKSFVAFESYHGTRGSGLVFDAGSKSWVSIHESTSSSAKVSSLSNGTTSGHKKRDLSSLHNLHVESSPGAVEVAQRLPIQGYQHFEQNDDGSSDDGMSSNDPDEDEGMEVVDEDVAVSDEELEDVEDMDIDLDDMDLDLDDDSSDTNAALRESDGSTIPGPDDSSFAHVSRAAIIPYQSSISGSQPVGPGPRGAKGEMFEYKIANKLMKDLSHLGMIHVPASPMNCLVKLPKSFVELYGIVNRVKGCEGRSDDAEDDSGFETAICLLTGTVMRSGTIRRMKKDYRPPGTCTLHARKVGSGIGIFFLVQKCTVLLMHNNKSAYSPSLYVDEHGEEDVGLRRGRPLFFSEDRYQALETLWRSHGIPREVSQIRSTSDRVIRDNWY
eukprot:CCRYP_015624-RA/>CCRYP_015624-RA protein AED:0.01 eAED:0.01 QI:221/1/1/1/0.6/0.66/6/2355/3495